MPAAEADPVSIKVTLSPKSREVVSNIRHETGVANVTAMERILEWYSSLDRKLRLAVLNRDAATRDELLSLVVQEMAQREAAKGIGDDLGPADVVALMRECVDRSERLFAVYTRQLGVTPGVVGEEAKEGVRHGPANE